MELLGRLPELTACQEALSGDRQNATAAIIAGPPGIGKTSLWRAVADSPLGDAVVLRTTGISGTLSGPELVRPVMAARERAGRYPAARTAWSGNLDYAMLPRV